MAEIDISQGERRQATTKTSYSIRVCVYLFTWILSFCFQCLENFGPKCDVELKIFIFLFVRINRLGLCCGWKMKRNLPSILNQYVVGNVRAQRVSIEIGGN